MQMTPNPAFGFQSSPVFLLIMFLATARHAQTAPIKFVPTTSSSSSGRAATNSEDCATPAAFTRTSTCVFRTGKP